MGIKKFYSFFPKEVCCEEESMSNYKGKIVAIDAMHSLYTKCIGIRNSGKDILNGKGDCISHLISLLNLSNELIGYEILPIYVFDNKTPQIKQDTINDRKKIKRNATVKCTKISDKKSDEYIKYFKRAYFLDNMQVDACKKLLSYSGIPFVSAVNEADSQCAALTYDKLVNGVISNDTDLLLFGATKLILEFNKFTNIATVIRLDDVIDYLTYKANMVCDGFKMKRIKATRDTFIDFAIMMGTDYTRPIIGISHEELFEIFVLTKFDVLKTVEYLVNLRNRDKDIYIPENFIEKWQDARRYYLEAKIVMPAHINKKMEEPKIDLLMDFLCEKQSIEPGRVKKNITCLVNYYNCKHAKKVST